MDKTEKDRLIDLFNKVIAVTPGCYTEAVKEAFREYHRGCHREAQVSPREPSLEPAPVPAPRVPITANSGRLELLRDIVNMFQDDKDLFTYVNERGFYAPTPHFKVFMANRKALDTAAYEGRDDAGQPVQYFYTLYDVGAVKDYISMTKNWRKP